MTLLGLPGGILLDGFEAHHSNQISLFTPKTPHKRQFFDNQDQYKFGLHQ
jgi:hypothetical protein